MALGEGGLIIPGRWRVGGGYREPVRWAGGAQTDNWLDIAALETVVTPLGSFQAWRAPNGSTSSDGQTVSGTDWWVPDLGQPAQFEAKIGMPDGATLKLRAVITATTLKR